MASGKADTELKAQTQNYPLHSAIFKFKFNLAADMLAKYNASPHVVNNYGSNAMHILFANFSSDATNAAILATQLIASGADINLVDTNGFTPLHVAIKKDQQPALDFAFSFNTSSSK
jgi:ankyrin repeat protein